MKRLIFLVLVFMIICKSIVFAEETQVEEKTIVVPKCYSPIAKIAIGKIVCKAASCKNTRDSSSSSAFLQQLLSIAGTPSFEGIGDGIADMMLSSLKATGCFEVLDREQMAEIQKELALLGKQVQLDAADYLIGGAITSLTMESSNTNLGGGVLPVLSLFNVKKTKAIIEMDIRVIDVETGKITFSKSYEANNSKTGLGVGGGAAYSGVGFGGIYSSLKGTALESIVRDVVIRATVDIVNAKDTLKSRVVSSKPSPSIGNTESSSNVAGQIKPDDNTTNR